VQCLELDLGDVASAVGVVFVVGKFFLNNIKLSYNGVAAQLNLAHFVPFLFQIAFFINCWKNFRTIFVFCFAQSCRK
jgi:hypothetical protein